MKKTYTVDTWSIQELANLHIERKIIIPSFQRVFVWDKKRKDKFVDSLRAGYPFGTLLVYKDDNKYTLIDGLQRTTTILSYFKNPKDYFSKESLLYPEKIDTLSTEYKTTPDVLRSEIESWFKGLNIEEIDDLEIRTKFSEISLSSFLNTKFIRRKRKVADKEQELIDKTIAGVMDDIRRGYKIENSDIPVIIYEGDKINLPEVFRRLNKQGKPLTAYEILGATLSGTSMSLPDNEITKKILEKVERRSASYEKLGYVYEGDNNEDENEDDHSTSGINPFQYLYGLGKFLSERYPSLFGASDVDDFDVDSFAFNLICLYYKEDVTEMNDVIENRLAKANLEEIKELQKNIDIAACRVNDILRPYIDFSLSSKNKGTKFISPHSEYQIVAYVARMHHVLESKDKKAISEYEMLIKSSYVYDILDRKWSGTGNRKALEWVKGKNSRITKDGWEHILQSWLDDQNGQIEKKRSSQRGDAMLLLSYIYASSMTHEEATNETIYELDHLVPVKKLSDLIEREELEGLAVNSVANIALIPKTINRKKKDKTIYEAKLSANELKQLERFTFTESKDLNFAKEGSKSLSIDSYKAFLKGRSMLIKEKFLDLVKRWE